MANISLRVGWNAALFFVNMKAVFWGSNIIKKDDFDDLARLAFHSKKASEFLAKSFLFNRNPLEIL